MKNQTGKCKIEDAHVEVNIVEAKLPNPINLGKKFQD